MSTLIYQAKTFIIEGHPKELWPLLHKCVSSKSPEALVAVKMLARDMYGGITFNFELKAPAAHCLIAWDKDGLKTLVENVAEEPSSKNYSLAFQILAAVASGNPPAAAAMWVKDPELLELLLSSINLAELKSAAKMYLNQLVMSITDADDVAMYLGTALQGMALTESNAVKPLFQALSLRWTAAGIPQITEYEKLLLNLPTEEKAFHSFLERNPLFLDPLALRVWSKPDLHGKKEPDFVVQRADNTYLVIEIETPDKTLVTAQDQISAETTHAITQVLEYKAFLTERFADAAAIFPHFSTPEGLVVIGREDSLTTSQRAALRRENENRPNIRIMGFDALAERAHAITRNVIEAPIVVDSARL